MFLRKEAVLSNLKIIFHILDLNGHFLLCFFLALTSHSCGGTRAPSEPRCGGQRAPQQLGGSMDSPTRWQLPVLPSLRGQPEHRAYPEGKEINIRHSTPKVGNPSTARRGQREKKPNPTFLLVFCSLRESHKYKPMKTITPAAKAMKQFVREMTFLMRNTCWRRTKGPVWSERCS